MDNIIPIKKHVTLETKTYGKEKLIESVNPSRGRKSHAADIHTQTNKYIRTKS